MEKTDRPSLASRRHNLRRCGCKGALAPWFSGTVLDATVSMLYPLHRHLPCRFDRAAPWLYRGRLKKVLFPSTHALTKIPMRQCSKTIRALAF